MSLKDLLIYYSPSSNYDWWVSSRYKKSNIHSKTFSSTLWRYSQCLKVHQKISTWKSTKKAPRAKKGGKIQFPRILLPWIKRSLLIVILKHCEWKLYFWHLTWRTKHNNNLIFIQKSLIQWTTQRKTLLLLQIDTLQISQFWRECKIVFEANKTSNILYLTGNELYLNAFTILWRIFLCLKKKPEELNKMS